MNIKELAKKYDLVEGDFWNHKQSGQWILTHDAVEKIANIENINFFKLEVLNAEMDLVRFLITMIKEGKTSKSTRRITSVGEADRNNCFSQYLGCMAEKRGVDRCVLKLINAYEYGISSEVEAEDFKRPAHYQKTENQIEQFATNLKHPLFNGKKTEAKMKWDDADTLSKTEFILTKMNEKIENYKESE